MLGGLIRPQVMLSAPFWGMTFATDDYASPPAPLINNLSTYTIEGWVNLPSLTRYDTFYAEAETGTVNNIIAFHIESTSRISMLVKNSAAGTWITYSANSVLSTDRWIHVAAVRDGGTIHVVVNGVTSGTPVSGVTGTFAPDNVHIGAAEINVLGRYLEGTMVCLRIRNTARTDAQIQATMYRPFLGPTANLVAEYPMLPGYGQVLTDNSGNGHHGQLGSTGSADTNDPTWIAAPYRRIEAGGPS